MNFLEERLKKKNFFWQLLKRIYEELSIKINLSKVIFLKTIPLKEKKQIILIFYLR